MLEFVSTGQFRRYLKLMRKQSQDMELGPNCIRRFLVNRGVSASQKLKDGTLDLLAKVYQEGAVLPRALTH